jgi:chaperonin GroEL (HSP60 family)
MSLLNSKHSKDGAGYGIDAVNREVADLDGRVVDPYLVVKSWLVSAVELATTIIGVDEVILTTKPKTEEKS